MLYSTDVNFIASQAIARSQQRVSAGEEGMVDESSNHADAMAALERQTRAPMGFVASSTGPEGGNRAPPNQQPTAPVNPDAIDLDMDEE